MLLECSWLCHLTLKEEENPEALSFLKQFGHHGSCNSSGRTWLGTSFGMAGRPSKSFLQRRSTPSEEESWARSQDRSICRRPGKSLSSPCLSFPTSQMGTTMILLLLSLHFGKDQMRPFSFSAHPSIAKNVIKDSFKPFKPGTELSGKAAGSLFSRSSVSWESHIYGQILKFSGINVQTATRIKPCPCLC